MNKHNIPFWLNTIAVFIFLIVPTLLQYGMFMDGVTYSSISRNLANGIGSFWKPQYTKTFYQNFYEHPPLVFGIQSLFFKITGDGIYTERIYTFLCALLAAIGIAGCWRLFNKQNDLKNYSWLPVLLWISVPIVFWSYKNNMLENTMGLFTLFSIFFILKGLIQEKIIWIITGSILIVMAFLSKGFTGLFPMATVLIYWLIFKNKNIRIPVIYGLITILLPIILFYSLLTIFPAAKENFLSYLHQQIIPSLNGQKDVSTNSHFSILLNLVMELSIPIFFLLFLIIRKRIYKRNIQLFNLKFSVLFILIGISASLPIIISPKHREYYLAPSIPYFIIGLSILIAPYLKNIIESFSELTLKWIKKASVVLIVFALVFSFSKIGKYSRDEEKLKDIYLISETIPKGTIMHTTKEIWSDWSLIAYLSRIDYLSLDCDNDHEYFLIKKDDKLQPDLLMKYDKMNLDLKEYIILKKKIINPDLDKPEPNRKFQKQKTNDK